MAMALPSINLSLSASLFCSPPGHLQSSLPLSRTTQFSPLLKAYHLSLKPTRIHYSTSDKNSPSLISSNVNESKEDAFGKSAQGHGGEVADRWREIHGQNNWDGLLNGRLLRSELIRYGEFAQACSDSYDFDLFSFYCGSNKYRRHEFFADLDMADCGYDVTRFLYATGPPSHFLIDTFLGHQDWNQNVNCIGYVAVSNDEKTAWLGRRDILVVWRGTGNNMEWAADANIWLERANKVIAKCPDRHVKVHQGFLTLYAGKNPDNRSFSEFSAREQVLAEVSKLVEEYADNRSEEVTVTVIGHSLGGAMATLSGYDLAETGAIVTPKGNQAGVTVFSYSGPRIGNKNFRDRFAQVTGLKALLICNKHDMVPKLPGMFLNEGSYRFVQTLLQRFPLLMYFHVGVKLEVDHQKSPFLQKKSDNMGDYHNLETLLHLLDYEGYEGTPEEYKEKGRDLALVNKSCGFLKEELLVPPSWKQEVNKGMFRGKDRRWYRNDKYPQPYYDLPNKKQIHKHLQRLGLRSN